MNIQQSFNRPLLKYKPKIPNEEFSLTPPQTSIFLWYRIQMDYLFISQLLQYTHLTTYLFKNPIHSLQCATKKKSKIKLKLWSKSRYTMSSFLHKWIIVQNDDSPQQHNTVNQLFQQTETIIIQIDIFIAKRWYRYVPRHSQFNRLRKGKPLQISILCFKT